MPCHVSNVSSNTSLPGWGSLLSRPVGTGRASVMGTEAIAVTSWDDMVAAVLLGVLPDVLPAMYSKVTADGVSAIAW